MRKFRLKIPSGQNFGKMSVHGYLLLKWIFSYILLHTTPFTLDDYQNLGPLTLGFNFTLK